MSRALKATMMGLLTGVVGLVFSFTPVALDVEEGFGLRVLFQARGPKPPPSEVIIVSMDERSGEMLNVHPEHDRWPRCLHARLVDILSGAGASVIVFDVLFNDIRTEEDNRLFADAVRKAGNVVLFEAIKKDLVPLKGASGMQAVNVSVEKTVTPIPQLAQSAIALAPFPLPKVPVRVNQFWTFKAGSGDTATLPVAAFQVFAMDRYDELVRMLDQTSSSLPGSLPRNRDDAMRRGVEQVLNDLRTLFTVQPRLAQQLLDALERQGGSSLDPGKNRILHSLVKMYQSPDSLYMNLYGPPGTISTIPYAELLHAGSQPASVSPAQLDFRGKAVFVGVSGDMKPEQQDGFYTVFSQQNGVDITGVELAATAFANILEDNALRPLSPPLYIFLIFFWGVALGAAFYLLPTFFSVLALAGLPAAYFLFALDRFVQNAGWYPLVTPLFIQTPLAFLGAFLWKHREINTERENIRKAFSLYLPDQIVDQLARDRNTIGSLQKIVTGTCLCTDGEQYVKLSEHMDPRELARFLNRYYETLFEPVKRFEGMVSDVVGDSMMAIWASDRPDRSQTVNACVAALEIAASVESFNALPGSLSLPTRMGLHYGQMSLGSIGGADHYEYRPVGDAVNTASRIESLNKLLGTRILATADVLEGTERLLTRQVGEFVLAGKSNPVVVHELLGYLEDSSARQKDLCAVFAEGLPAFRTGDWETALGWFNKALLIMGDDGPAQFYIRLCEQYMRDPPNGMWTGLIRLAEK